MDEKLAREMQGIRSLQSELRLRMNALDRRIERLEPVPELVPAPEEFIHRDTLQPPPMPVFDEEASWPDPVVRPRPSLPAANKLLSPVVPAPAAARKESPKVEVDSLELRLGRVWLVRIGVVIFLTGLVFLGGHAWTHLAPIGKIALTYLAGSGLGGFGWLVKRRREELAAYGKVLIGGGIATVYYATYAAHFVEPLRVIASPFLGGAVLMALAAGIIWLADRIRSEAVAAATIALGFYTAAINPVAGFSLFSNVVLSLIAMTLLVRRRWVSVSFLSLTGCYLAFAFWRVHSIGTLFLFEAGSAQAFWNSFLFPVCYWVVFTAAVFLGRAFTNGARLIFLTINNAAFFALTAPLIAGTYQSQLWLFTLAYGILLLVLSRIAVRVDAGEAAFDGTYLTQGLALIFMALVFKFSGYQVAIILALQSATLLKLSLFRHGRILQVFSGISAVASTAYASGALVRGEEHAVITAVSVSVILIATGWLFKSQRGLLNPLSFQWRPAGYAALAALLGVAAILQGSDGTSSLYLLASLAVLATASVFLLRMPEVVLGAQGIAAVAVAQWFVRDFHSHADIVPFAAIAVTCLALMHWWQRQHKFSLGESAHQFWQWFHVVLLLAVTFGWMLMRFSGPHRALALASGALSLLAYAFQTRARPLAIGSQFFSAATLGALVIALPELNPWRWTLGTIIVFAAQSAVLALLKKRAPEADFLKIEKYGQLLRAISIFLCLCFIEIHIIEARQFAVLAAIAFALFGIGAWKQNSEALAYAAAAIALGYLKFVLKNVTGDPVFSVDFVGLGLILLAQQLGKNRLEGEGLFSRAIQSILITAGLAGVWLMTERMIAGIESGFLLTASWSVLAFAVLGGGFLLKERTYRLIGLFILTCAIGRIFFVDVWQLETIYRILSFLVLGAVLLALGFLYNRFANMIRKWI